MSNVNKKIMECLLIVWMHINRGELSTGRTLPRRPQIRLRHFLHHGCLSRAFILSTPIPSEFTGRPLTTSLEVPQPEKEKRPPPSLKSSLRKKNSKPPLSSSSNQKDPLPYVTGSYVTSLSNVLQSLGQDQIFHQPTVKFRHPPVFSLQRDSGPCFAEKQRSTGAGEKEKEHISSPLLFISWHKQIIISHTQEFKTIKSPFK
ncbi:hypothetical protein AVEN_220890-1 [Araneus ventricosus]|uniref:Uncharacterized protein n=1 Tax=Araneus ventricosus TaxID=182803 RepID=A0A4Y2HX95_ARAVE|nr:hypothetical protein AVEN_220890-1 [Araneus ventricosus]